MDLIDQFDIAGGAIVARVVDPVAQDFGFLEDVAPRQPVEHLGELVVGEPHLVVLFKLGLEVGDQCRLIGDCHPLPAERDQLGNQFFFKLGF